MSSSGSPGPAPTRLTSGGLGWGLVCVVEGVLRMPVKLLVFGRLGKGHIVRWIARLGAFAQK